MKHSIIIANWKMYYTFDQAYTWCKENKQDLIHLIKNNLFILCPSYESLYTLSQLFIRTPIALGAQNCSEFSQGAYTGQISAQSLSTIGVTYCIIGHSEARNAYNETNEQLLHKLEQLIACSITPIFCIGETKKDYEKNSFYEKINYQLEPLITLFAKIQKNIRCFIAYEPMWSIGTGIVAHNDHISSLLQYIKKKLDLEKNAHTISLLYGGTVTSQTILELKKVKEIEGFLIGKASTNFQELKNIVSLL